MTSLLSRIDRPQDLHELSEDELQAVAQEVRELLIDTVGEIGGHFGANLGTCEIAVARALADGLAARQDPVGRRPPGLPAQGPDRSPRRARHDPPLRRPRAVLLDRRVRARHHGRRPRLDVDRLRRRHQGGDAARGHRGRQGRRGHRRRRDDRRRRVRGRLAGRRPRHADRRDPQRQRDVDRAQRRRAVALHEPRPAGPGAVGGARGRRGEAHEAAGRHRRRVRAPRPALQGVREGLLGSRPVVGGARLGLPRRDRRPRRARDAPRAAHRLRGRAPGRHPLRHGQGQGLRARPRTAAWRAWRSGMPPSRSRSRSAAPRRRVPPRPRRRSTRRSSATRWCASASATRA